jgi:hypothetical protein
MRPVDQSARAFCMSSKRTKEPKGNTDSRRSTMEELPDSLVKHAPG